MKGGFSDLLGQCICQLDFVARTSITTGQGLENRRLDYIAANNGNVRLGVFRLWFFNKPLDLDQFAVICARRDDAIGLGLVCWDIHRCDHIAALVMRYHFRNTALAKN